jgi:hypothetical protein
MDQLEAVAQDRGSVVGVDVVVEVVRGEVGQVERRIADRWRGVDRGPPLPWAGQDARAMQIAV